MQTYTTLDVRQQLAPRNNCCVGGQLIHFTRLERREADYYRMNPENGDTPKFGADMAHNYKDPQCAAHWMPPRR